MTLVCEAGAVGNLGHGDAASQQIARQVDAHVELHGMRCHAIAAAKQANQLIATNTGNLRQLLQTDLVAAMGLQMLMNRAQINALVQGGWCGWNGLRMAEQFA